MNAIDVHIKRLEPMRVASSYGFGEHPEEQAWQIMAERAGPRGLLDSLDAHPISGFKVGPEVEPEGLVRIVELFGGTYAVRRCEVVGHPEKTAPESWQRLARCCKRNDHPLGQHPALERFLSDPVDLEHLVLDLYCPIGDWVSIFHRTVVSMHIGYPLFLALFITCLIIRSSYEVLKKSGKINPASKPLFAAIFTTMCMLWVSWFAMCPDDPLRIPLPASVQGTGLALVILGTCAAVGALVQLKGLENIDRLVTTGLFSKLRHPMYTGFLFWILGWSMYHGALASFLTGLVGVGNILYWRRLEEQKLESQYGEVYQVYRRHTWF